MDECKPLGDGDGGAGVPGQPVVGQCSLTPSWPWVDPKLAWVDPNDRELTPSWPQVDPKLALG